MRDMEDEDLYWKLGAHDPDQFLLMDGFDDCISGVVERFGQPPVACYDKEMVIKRLTEDGMSQEEAEEFYQFNHLGSYVGEMTPCFLIKPVE